MCTEFTCADGSRTLTILLRVYVCRGVRVSHRRKRWEFRAVDK
jgi:hypothetical protein